MHPIKGKLPRQSIIHGSRVEQESRNISLDYTPLYGERPKRGSGPIGVI